MKGIKCRICGNRFGRITHTHLARHNMTMREYKEKYGGNNLISKETRKKIIEYQRNRSIQHRRRQSEALKGSHHMTMKGRGRRSEFMKKNNPMNNLSSRRKLSRNLMGREITWGEKISKSIRKIYKDPNSIYNDPEYQKNRISNTLKSIHQKPNGLEKKFINFFNSEDLSFIYTGDGSLMIGNKNPDFRHESESLLIEVANRQFREAFQEDVEGEVQKKIKFYRKHGWKCLWLWEEDLKDSNKLLDEIRVFMGVKE